jgi:hypothetical protein
MTNKEPWQMTPIEFVRAHLGRFARQKGQRGTVVLSIDGAEVWPARGTVKDLWKCRDYVRNRWRILNDIHRQQVIAHLGLYQRGNYEGAMPHERHAFKQGPVPAHVLAEYPELQRKEAFSC